MNRDGLVIVAAEAMLGLLGPDELSSAAVAALEGDLDSPALVALASLPKGADAIEARALFDRALNELNVTAPSPRDAIICLAEQIAAEIVRGAVAPYAGAKRIWELSRRGRTERIRELDPFIYAASEWEERPEDRVRFEQDIICEARALSGTLS